MPLTALAEEQTLISITITIGYLREKNSQDE
jgi:hypothetical protein